MLSKIILVVFLIFSVQLAFAQHKDYRLTVLQTVYTQLIEAFGNKSKNLPILTHLYQGKNRVAEIYQKNGQYLIRFDTEAYRICQNLGKDSLNAIAIILAHELGHYYQGIVQQQGIGFIESRSEIESHKQDEIKADVFAGFATYLAGYTSINQTNEVYEKVIKQVYTTYQLSETGTIDYPSLQERKVLLGQSKTKIDALNALYEMATYMNLLHHYEEAIKCYKIILEDFQSREIYNNIGISIAMFLVNNRLNNSILKFQYPFELDATTRLFTTKTRETDHIMLSTDTLLEYAKESFKKARMMDTTYTFSYLNSACLANLTGAYQKFNQQDSESSFNEAIIYAKHTIKLAAKGSKTEADAQIIQVINSFYLKEIDQQQAINCLKRIETSPIIIVKRMATYNASVIKNFSKENKKIHSHQPCIEKEVAKESLYAINPCSYEKVQKSIAITNSHNATIFQYRFPNNKIMTIVKPKHLIATKQKIDINTHQQQLENSYGCASYQLNSKQGSYYLYKKVGLIFFVDNNNKVCSWVGYCEQ